MANLIPPQAKKQVVHEYWIRVASVWLILLGMAAIVIGVLNVPVYVLVKNQHEAYRVQYEQAGVQKTSFEKIEGEIDLANDMTALLATISDYEPISFYLDSLERLLNPNVTVSNYRFLRDGQVLRDIQISGTAANRQSLVALSQAIEDSPHFTSAEIPLSNLAKNKDIPFTITVVLAPSENL